MSQWRRPAQVIRYYFKHHTLSIRFGLRNWGKRSKEKGKENERREQAKTLNRTLYLMVWGTYTGTKTSRLLKCMKYMYMSIHLRCFCKCVQRRISHQIIICISKDMIEIQSSNKWMLVFVVFFISLKFKFTLNINRFLKL